MYKINTTDQRLLDTLAKRGIKNYTDEYQYVLTDDQSLFENNKINILFTNADIDEISSLVKWIALKEDIYIEIKNANGIKRIKAREIDYFEALDNDVYAIVDNEKYDVFEKLYVLEEMLTTKDFVRISKSFLVNTLKIDFIKPLFNYKLELKMLNGHKLEVNRTYVKTFKERINLRWCYDNCNANHYHRFFDNVCLLCLCK